MAVPVERTPLWLQALGTLIPLATAALTAYLGFRFGLTKSDHDLKIETKRLEAQAEREAEKALRDAREQRIRTWREAVARYTGTHPDTRATRFNHTMLSRAEAYLSLRGHLDQTTQRRTEGTYTGPWVFPGGTSEPQ